MKPLEQLTTPRLQLQRVRSFMASEVFAAICYSLTSLRQFPVTMPWAVHEPRLEITTAYCKDAETAWEAGRDFIYAVLASDATLCGLVGLHSINATVPKCEVGFWGNRSYSRQGYMSEAVQAVLVHCFGQLGMMRVYAISDVENVAAQRVCLNSGMTVEGILRNDRRCPVAKELRSMCLMSAVP